MKFKHLLIAITASLFALTSVHAVVITDFDVNDGFIVEDYSTFPTYDYSDGNLYVEGTGNDTLGATFNPVTISDISQIYLTATIHSAEGIFTQFYLYNSDYSQYMIFDVWLDTVGVSTTFKLEYSDIQEHLSFYDIAAFDFFTGGLPFNSLAITFERLTAIPEPHTYALILTGLLTIGLIVRRQRHS